MATDLAKAYVQNIPSADGIKQQLTDVLGRDVGAAGDEAGKSLGSSLISRLKNVIIAAGIGKAIGASLTEGAALQQSLGGVETLFKESADKVVTNARNAYKNAGMSANEYMETITGFSASLLQSLGQDTEKAAVYADRAIVDMSDNANKMGTSMEMIQNAYQGFAKQNYTMLDNLKLGYGGTQEEMKRLIKDASKMKDTQKELGITVDASSMSFGNIVNAISVMQSELGIAGTTAAEASQTFSGSFAAMKAAAQDFLGNLALGENVAPSLAALGETVYTFMVDNLVPMVGNIMLSLGEVIVSTDWVEAAQTLITKLRDDIAEAAGITIGEDTCVTDELMRAISEQLPLVLEKGVEMVTNLVNGILQSLPNVVTSAGELVTRFLNFILENGLPQILAAGVELVLNLVNGVIQSLPKIADAALNVSTKLLTTITNNAPKLLEAGITLIGKLAAGLIQAIPDLISKIPTIINKIKEKFTSIDWKSVGTAIIQGIAKGISNGVNSIVKAAKDAAKKALDAAKKALGIKSPSRVFRDQVGKMIDEGLAVGIESNLKTVTDAMKKLKEETVGSIDTNLIFSYDLQKGYASELKKDNIADIDWERMFEGMVFEIVNNFNVDGTPLKEKISNYTMKKITARQKAVSKAKGVFA